MTNTAAKTREIEISEWKTYERNTLKGFFTATLPSGMVLHHLMLHKKGEARWISAPAREAKDENGNAQFLPFLTFTTPDTRNRFRDSILAALDEQKPWEQK